MVGVPPLHRKSPSAPSLPTTLFNGHRASRRGEILSQPPLFLSLSWVTAFWQQARRPPETPIALSGASSARHRQQLDPRTLPAVRHRVKVPSCSRPCKPHTCRSNGAPFLLLCSDLDAAAVRLAVPSPSRQQTRKSFRTLPNLRKRRPEERKSFLALPG